MSSTRYADEGDELKQNRWASSPDFSTSVKALTAAKRIALIPDRELREVLWFIQWRSLQPNGLRQLCDEILTMFPGRVGTPTLRRFGASKRTLLREKEIRALRSECGIWEEWAVAMLNREFKLSEIPLEEWKLQFYQEKALGATADLSELLVRFCLDPNSDISKGVWFFEDLIGALISLRERSAAGARTQLADTEVNRQIYSALDFCFRRRRMILIEGKAGIGKTAAIKAWCDQRQGLARYVEVPSSNDDRSFFAAIAEALGVARGTSYNGQQIKLRVEEVLRESGLMLVFDESQFMWPQYIRPQGIPSRIQWIKSAFDAGTPIALAALPKFSEWQSLYARRTLWDDDQLERRLNRKVPLPDAHSKEDLLKIARARHPGGDKASWTLLAGYALAAAKKQASAITEALESALDTAQQDGRDAINYDDIDAAVQLDFKPMPAPARVEKGKTTQPARSLQPTCRDIEKPLPSSRRAPSSWADLQPR